MCIESNLTNHPAIFISSSDAYSDLWPVFFDLFKQCWPEYKGIIYLNTENKVYKCSDLNIECTQVGANKAFGMTFRKGLDKVKSENLLLIMIDYLFLGKVNEPKFIEYYNYFSKNNLDSLCLVKQNYPNQTVTESADINLVTGPAPHIMFSYQIAFWKKSILYQMALPHENPWTSEWYGTKRAEKMHIKLACISEIGIPPIPYHLAGCLHKGKWIDEAVNHLKKINYAFDFSKRGPFIEFSQTLSSKLKIKYMLVKDGLRGSYWDLLNRKRIQ
jgi:hypothetical protein